MTDKVIPLPEDVRALFREAGRRGGKAGGAAGGRKGGKASGARKARSPEAVQIAVRARLKARRGLVARHAELLEIAREVGAYLDGLTCLVGDAETQRLELVDRLYGAVSRAKAGKVKLTRAPGG